MATATTRGRGVIGSLPKTVYVLVLGFAFVCVGVALDVFGADLLAGLAGALAVLLVALAVFWQVLVTVLGRLG